MLKKLLLFLSTILSCLLAGGLFLVSTINLDDYRARIAEILEAHTGRKVSVGEELQLKLLPQPSLVLTDIRLANTPWGATPDMLTVRRLDAELKLQPLFNGEIVIRRIGLHDATLWLERNRSGEPNWLFATKENSETEPPDIEELTINGLTIGWRNHKYKEQKQVQLSLAVLRKQHHTEALQLELLGKYRDRPLQVGAQLPLLQLNSDQTRIKFQEIKASLGSSDIRGDLLLDLRPRQNPRITADLHSNHLRLEDFYDPGVSEPPPDKVFDRDTLSLSILKPWNGSVAYQAKRLRRKQLVIADLRLDFELENGTLAANANIGSSTKVRLRLNAAAQPPRVDLTYSAKNLELADLVSSGGRNGPLTGRGDLLLQLRGRGDSIATLMASLNGYARLLAGKGRLHVGNIDTLTGGLWNILGTLTAKNSKSAVMNCMATDFEIKNGVATSRAFLIDSEHATLFGNGNIDLGRERINFLLKPTPKTVTLNVAVPVEVGGTLKKPNYQLKRSQTARKAIGVVGLFVFPPAALIGLGELGTGEENPCLRIARDGTVAARQPRGVLEQGETAVKETLHTAETKMKEGETAVKKTLRDTEKKIQQGGTAVKETLRDVGGKIEGLFGK
jgi:uncharacterized protein involved in outer membrane biogenesis